MRIAFGVAVFAALAACGGDSGPTEIISNGSVKTVKLSASGVTVQAGETSPMTVTARDSAHHMIVGRTVTWLSRDPTIVTVSSTGVLSAVAEGTAYVTATVDTVTDSVSVHVITKVAYVVILPQFTHVVIPNRLQMSVLLQDSTHTAIPGTVLGGSTWSVSDIGVATIGPTGLLQSKGVGSVVVTARFQSGSFPAFTSTTTVFVDKQVGG